MTADELASMLVSATGFPESGARYLANLEEGIAGGFEERLVADEGDKVWKSKVSIREFFEKNKEAWIKK